MLLHKLRDYSERTTRLMPLTCMNVLPPGGITFTKHFALAVVNSENYDVNLSESDSYLSRFSSARDLLL
jgi:hypothetical protein